MSNLIDTQNWHRYVEYHASLGGAYGVSAKHRGTEMTVIPRIPGAPCSNDSADICIQIKPGTSKKQATAMLARIAKAIEEYGNWEHTTRDPDLTDDIPF